MAEPALEMNPLLEDFEGQPDSLRGVFTHLAGAGKDALHRAAAELRHARQVIFTGMGSSLFATLPAVALLNAHGRRATSIEASELLYYGTATISTDTAIVLVSRSGNTVEVVKLVPLLRARGAHLIGVTNVVPSALNAQADVVINVNSAPDHLVALRTYTGSTAVLLSLAASVLGQTVAHAEEIAAQADALIKKSLMANMEWLNGARCLYLLGRGASMASVREGALLFHESARTPAVPMSCAGFRHGPVEVVSPDFRAFVFATQSATQVLDRQMADDLTRLGAQVHLVDTDLIGRSDGFATVLEIIPVQAAAIRLAELRRHPAG